MGMSAYLTDTDTYKGTFRTADGNDLGFKLTGTEYNNKLLTPGDTVQLNAVAKVEQPNDLYIFVKIDIPSDSDDSTVYYYGSETSLIALEPTHGASAPILDSITLSPGARSGADYTLTITGYAIQAQYISPNSPANVFSMTGRQ
ncbi:MAG: hypothetical protein IJP53_00790 [Synergistaceae bacterium]|nr:hypothetical protein [Synergistaceae bacterium]